MYGWKKGFALVLYAAEMNPVYNYNTCFGAITLGIKKSLVWIAVRDQMFLGMQEFDFTQI